MSMNETTRRQPFRANVTWISDRLYAMPEALRILMLTFFLGWLTHGFVYANTLFGHDNILPYAGPWSALRWATPMFYLLRANLQIPWVIGSIALLELGVINSMLARLLSLKRLSGQVLLIVTVLTFPSVIAFHNYGAVDLFTGSLLCGVLAVSLLNRKGVAPFLLATVSLTVCIASYQAFVGTAASLILIWLLADLTIQQAELKQVLRNALKGLTVLALSIALYYLVFLWVSSLPNAVGATSYRQEDAMGVFNVTQLLQWIREAYRTLAYYYLGGRFNPLPLWVCALQWACLAIVLCATAVRLAARGFFRQPLRVALTLGVFALFPMAINVIQILNSGLEPHLLMTFAYVVPWFLILQYGCWLADTPPEASRPRSAALARGLAALCALLIGVNGCYGYVLANADYVGRKLNYDASLSLATRMVDRIENVDGYTPQTPVMIVGGLWTDYAMKPRKGFELTYTIVGSFTTTGQAMTYNDGLGSTIQWYISSILSSNMVFVPNTQMAAYQSLPAVQSLRPFPEKDCCTWVDGVLVLKLSE